MILYSGDDLHSALCKAFGVEEERGSRSEVAKKLDEWPQHYSKHLSNPVCPLKPVTRWATRAGIVMIIHDGHATFAQIETTPT